MPRKVKIHVKQVVKEIEEKTIQILDKGQLKNKQNKNETEEIKVISDKKDEVSEKDKQQKKKRSKQQQETVVLFDDAN